MNPLVSIGLVTVFLIFIYYLYVWLFNTKQVLHQNKIYLKEINNESTITNITNASNTRYAYGIWVLVNDVLPTDVNTIFYRPNNIRVYIKPNSSSLCCEMIDKRSGNVSVITNSFQLQKWAHIVVSVDNQFIDYYFNGKLVKTEKKQTLLLTPGGYTPDDNTIASPPIYLGNANNKTDATNYPQFDAYVSKFARWTAPLDPQSVWNEYLAGNGESFIPYGVNLDVLKNNVTQTSYHLW